MAYHLINRTRSAAPRTRMKQSSLPARSLLFAVLCSHLSTVTASPVASLPASAPGFHSGAVPATHDVLPDSWIDTLDLDPVALPTELDFEEDNDWDLEYEDLINSDERMGVDGMGKAVVKSMDSSTSPHTHTPHPDPADIGPLTLPESLFASLARILELGFWKGLLGSFLVFWVLIASTVGALVVIGVRVKRMERRGELRRWRLGSDEGEGEIRMGRRKEVWEATDD